MVEFFDAARHIAYRTSCSASFFIVLTKASVMHFGPVLRNESERQKQYGRVSEALNAVRHAQPTAGTCILCLYRSDKTFGYEPEIDAAPEGMRA